MKRSARTPAGLFHLSPLAERGRIALAIRVRGIRRKGGLDGFDNARHVSQYVIIPESQNAIVVIGKPFIANFIARIFGMLSTVQLDYKASFATNKVDRVRSNRFLPNKLDSIQPSRPQSVPQRFFRICRRLAQAPRPSGLEIIRTSHLATPPHPARECAPTSPRTRGEVSTPPVPA